MTITDISYTTRDGEDFTGILAAPDGDGKLPGILFITAIWGIDGSARQITKEWAEAGFVVSVPDIFWRLHPGQTADPEIAHGRYNAYDVDQGLLDLQDLIGHLRAHPRCNGKIGVLGICFGGRYAHLAAARYGIDAAAAYHGTYIEKHLDETHKITCPVSFHFGALDPVIQMDDVCAIQNSYAAHPNAEIVAHTGADHNFAMPHKDAYDPAIAATAREAVLRCFRSM
jgi:carboxymethylenebutenolidase